MTLTVPWLFSVGDGVGTGVGATVGDGVGAMVGGAVGAGVGATVGAGVGASVGVAVGGGVGGAVGGTVGGRVGVGFWVAVGATVGEAVGVGGTVGVEPGVGGSVTTGVGGGVGLPAVGASVGLLGLTAATSVADEDAGAGVRRRRDQSDESKPCSNRKRDDHHEHQPVENRKHAAAALGADGSEEFTQDQQAEQQDCPDDPNEDDALGTHSQARFPLAGLGDGGCPWATRCTHLR